MDFPGILAILKYNKYFARMYLRYNVTHVNIRIRIFRIEYSLDLHEFVDQLEHPVIFRIL